MPEDRSALKELDRWVAYLMDCQQLPEGQVKTLCEKVGCSFNTFYSFGIVHIDCNRFVLQRGHDKRLFIGQKISYGY